MCGRYKITTPFKDLAKLLGAGDLPKGAVEPSYNVAPTQMVAGAVERHGKRELVALRWGLVPSWAKDLKIGNSLINARAETVAEKPAFRSAFQRRRCLLPADGYYEWEAPQGPRGPKQPYLLTTKDGSPLMMAGLYEIWKDAEGMPWWTTTIITTDAPDEHGHIHNRTPMVIDPDRWNQWLDPEYGDPHGLMLPALNGKLEAIKVSTLVNNVKNNGPELVVPV